MADTSAKTMAVLASAVDRALNPMPGRKRFGFVLLVMPFDAPEGARANYASNADRDGMLAALKEVVARLEGQAEVRGRA